MIDQLDLQAIEVAFGDNRALKGVDVQCRAGQATMLIGPNGAGKSTLIKVLLGLVRADSGSLVFDGKPGRIDHAFKSNLGYLPEAAAFAENLTGRQVLRFFASARGCGKGDVNRVLERIGLTHAAGRTVRGYSRGMRQRLGLGAAILGDPHILIMDEPTGGLDQEGLSVLWDVMQEWRDKGRIVLISSHDLTLLENRVDTLYLLQAGRCKAHGSPGELRDRAGLPVTVAFLLGDSKPHVHLFLNAVRDCETVQDYRHEASSLTVEIPPDSLLHLMNLKALNEQAVRRIRVNEPGMDDVYETLLQEVV